MAGWFRKILGGARKPERDVPMDPGLANARDVGGVGGAGGSAPDQGSTTGSTPGGEYVGRVAGDDVGYAGETGAERRAEADRLDG